MSERNFTDWSGRHTRLRYQTVLSATIFYTAIILGIKSLKLPGVIEFEKQFDDPQIKLGLFIFAIFSLISFIFQHRLEKRGEPNYCSDLQRILRSLKEKLSDDEANFKNSLSKVSTKLEKIDEGAPFREKAEQIKDVAIGFIKWKNLQPEFQILTTAKTEISKLSPGDLSEGNVFLRQLESFEAGCKDIEGIIGALIKKCREGRWSKESLTEIISKTSLLTENLNNLEASLSVFEIDLIAHSKTRMIHASLLSFTIPLTISIGLLAMGVLKYFSG